jgi:WD40 repeat protein
LRVFAVEGEGEGVHDHHGAEHYALSPTEPLLVFTGQKRLTCHWLRDEREAQLSLPGEFGEVADLVFDRAGEQVLLISKEGRLARVSLAKAALTLQPIGEITVSEEAYFQFSLDGTRVAVLDRRRLPKADEKANPAEEWWLEVHDVRPARVAQTRVSEAFYSNEPDEPRWLSDGQQILVRTAEGTRLFRLREQAPESVPSPRPTGDWWGAAVVPGTGFLVHDVLQRPRWNIREVVARVSDTEGRLLMSTRYLSEYYADLIARVTEKRQEGTTIGIPGSAFMGSLTASPDGRYLATADASWNIRLWDLTNSDVDWRTTGHSKRVFHLQFTEDGSRLFTMGDDRLVVHWDVDTGAMLKRSQLPPERRKYLVEFNKTGDRILVLPIDQGEYGKFLDLNSCYVWDVPESRIVFVGETLSVANYGDAYKDKRFPHISHDGRFLVEAISSLPQNQVVIWNIESSKEHCRLNVHGELETAVIHPDGTIVTCSTHHGELYLQSWAVTDGQLLRTRVLNSLRVKGSGVDVSAGFTSQGRFAVLDLDGRQVWYDLEADRPISVAHHATADGRHVMHLDTLRRSLKIADIELGTVTAVPVPIEDVAFDWSVDGQTMFTANVDSTLSCWDAVTGQERVRFQTGLQMISKIAVSQRGDAVALADELGGVAVIRASLPDDTVE